MNTPAPDPYIAWQVVLTIGVVVAILANIYTAARSGRAQKREITFSETPASKREFDVHVGETRENFIQVRHELKEDRHDNQIHASARSSTLFNKVEDVRKELHGAMENNRRELSEQIAAMPDRVIATLKNTNSI